MKLENLRRSYTAGMLRRKSLKSDPFAQFEDWMNDAVDSNLSDPTAMILATVDELGAPSQRIVLLKSFTSEGFVFYTNYTSRKAQAFESNSYVCLHFPWHMIDRQIIVQGRIQKVSREVSEAYFYSRPRASQLGAWASYQSRVIPSRGVLESRYQSLEERFEGESIPMPDFWGGYVIVPSQIEFWQGGTQRLHDRFLYRRQSGDVWEIERLSP